MFYHKTCLPRFFEGITHRLIHRPCTGKFRQLSSCLEVRPIEPIEVQTYIRFCRTKLCASLVSRRSAKLVLRQVSLLFAVVHCKCHFVQICTGYHIFIGNARDVLPGVIILFAFTSRVAFAPNSGSFLHEPLPGPAQHNNCTSHSIYPIFKHPNSI